MKIKIHNQHSTDYFIIEGTLKECRQQAKEQIDRRGWINSWSEEIK